MNTENINQIIDKICEKLGIGVDNLVSLVPNFARYNITHYGTITALSLIVLLLIIFGIIKLWKIYFKQLEIKEGLLYDEEGIIIFTTIAGVLLNICFALVFVSNLLHLIEWIAAPDVKTIEYVIKMIK